jgi:hypothetical protein
LEIIDSNISTAVIISVAYYKWEHIVKLKINVFRDLLPSSPGESYGRFGGLYCLHLQDISNRKGANNKQIWVLVTYLVYASVLKMEAVCVLKTSVNIYQTTRRDTWEHSNILHSHRSEKLWSNQVLYVSWNTALWTCMGEWRYSSTNS